MLSQTVGMETDVDPDLSVVDMDSGDYLLLCSDGLTNELTHAQIQRIIRQSKTPHAGCEKLIHAANNAGGRDNISVVLARLH
jgi:protein phosphatase